MVVLVLALSLVVAETSTAEGRPIAVYSLGFFLLFSPKSRFVYSSGHWEGCQPLRSKGRAWDWRAVA